jgi:hypothetical protein
LLIGPVLRKIGVGVRRRRQLFSAASASLKIMASAGKNPLSLPERLAGPADDQRSQDRESIDHLVLGGPRTAYNQR